MPKIRNGKLKRMVWEHPYLLDRTFLLSRSKADLLWQQAGGYPGMEEIAARTKARYRLPAELWAPLDDALARRKRGGHIFSLIGTNVKGHRRLAVALTAILLMALFFGCVPAGRAMAREAVQLVLRVFEGGYEVYPNSTAEDTNAIREYVEPTQKEYASYEEFERDTGKSALYINSPSITLDELRMYESNAGLWLSAVYHDEEGRPVNIQQGWDIASIKTADTKEAQTWLEALWDGTIIQCYRFYSDGSFFGVAVWDASQLLVYAVEGVDHKPIIASVRAYTGEY